MTGKKVIILAVLFFSIMAAFSVVIIVSASGDNTNNTSVLSKPIDASKLKQITVHVEGMTCEDCEKTITILTGKQAGVNSINASYKTQSATLSYDASQTNKEKLMKSIASTGYKVLGYSDETGKHLLSDKNKTTAKPSMKCGAGKCGARMNDSTK